MITSRDNKFVKEIRSLQNKKSRDETGLFIIEGMRNAKEVLGTDTKIAYCLYTEKLAGDKLVKALMQQQIPCYDVKDSIFHSLSATRESQGIILAAKKNNWEIKQFFVESAGKNLAILDHIQDPGNLGTILRSAWAAGLGGIIVLANGVDIYNPKVVRAAMGALYHLPVTMITAEEAYFQLKQHDYEILVADANGEDYHEFKCAAKVAWLLGSEANGPEAFWRNKADFTLSIPMAKGVDSLNVAVAASILFFADIGEK
ncbi:MAG: RNA methyltransferase [Clostridia bacterium]|jgi:TrmH family RNA methyltransferase|nr:RNA methyltransferase [Clostridia bacterium]